MQKYRLSNGIEIPNIGFGTGIMKGYDEANIISVLKIIAKEQYLNFKTRGEYKRGNYTFKKDLRKDKYTPMVIANTLNESDGIRLFDTARAYANSERKLGEALKNSSLSRDEYFIITKARNWDQTNSKIEESISTSLSMLGLEYVDAYLLHWPQAGTYLNAWKTMEKIYESGKARSIGICNAHVHHLEELLKIAHVMPMVNEIECHPYLQQNDVLAYCRKHNIQMIAHTPTGRSLGILGENEVIKNLCSKYEKTVSQIVFRWHIQRGIIPIPNTTNYTHLKENIECFDFILSDNDMEDIGTLDCGRRVWPNPDNCDFAKL